MSAVSCPTSLSLRFVQFVYKTVPASALGFGTKGQPGERSNEEKTAMTCASQNYRPKKADALTADIIDIRVWHVVVLELCTRARQLARRRLKDASHGAEMTFTLRKR
jgi:hypothetical protein